MQKNNELVAVYTQPTVKDGENEELFKRMRTLKEVVKREQEEARKKELEDWISDHRKKYHKAIAVLYEKYNGIDREVVARLSNKDKERLADSIEKKVRKNRGWQRLFGLLQFLTAASAIGSLSYFVDPRFLFLFMALPLWAPVWMCDLKTEEFLNYRKQTDKTDRAALEAKPDGA